MKCVRNTVPVLLASTDRNRLTETLSTVSLSAQTGGNCLQISCEEH